MSWTRNSLCTVHSRAVVHLNAAATSKATAIVANGTVTTKNNYLALLLPMLVLILALLLRKSDTAITATNDITTALLHSYTYYYMCASLTSRPSRSLTKKRRLDS